MPAQGAEAWRPGMGKTRKAGLVLSVVRLRKNLRKGRYAKNIQVGAAVYMAGVLEYLLAEMLELSGQAARDNHKIRITPRHVKLAVKNDADIDRLVGDAVFTASGVQPFIHAALLPKKGQTQKTKRRQSGSGPGSGSESRTNGSTSNTGSRSRSRLTVEIVRRASPGSGPGAGVMHGESYYEEDYSLAV